MVLSRDQKMEAVYKILHFARGMQLSHTRAFTQNNRLAGCLHIVTCSASAVSICFMFLAYTSFQQVAVAVALASSTIGAVAAIITIAYRIERHAQATASMQYEHIQRTVALRMSCNGLSTVELTNMLAVLNMCLCMVSDTTAPMEPTEPTGVQSRQKQPSNGLSLCSSYPSDVTLSICDSNGDSAEDMSRPSKLPAREGTEEHAEQLLVAMSYS